MRVILGLGAVVGACGPRELPPLGEALVVVDTDLPVPRVASRLRVDTYTAEGTWFDSRDIALPDARDWPASFSVQAVDAARARDVVVRLRVYGERMQAYRGQKRLVRDGVDVTPKNEPAAGLAVDRLIALRLEPGSRGRARVVARGACAGTPAAVDGANGMRTCTERDGEREGVTPLPLEPDLSTPPTNVTGTLARTPCVAAMDPNPKPNAIRICVEGGAFVLGTDDVSVVPEADLPLTPERVVRVSTFMMDRDEVTVSRYREALSRGFVAPASLGTNEAALGFDATTTCTFSAQPLDREDFALTCVPWQTARAFCMHEGGDLPSEAQWEYAATSAGRSGKSEFPWGDDAPTCDRAVYGRLALAGFPGSCEERGRGPLPVFVAGEPVARGDICAVGVRGLAGGVSEWARDVAAPYDGPGWRSLTSALDPVCGGPAERAHSVRGGAWGATPILVRSTGRLSSAGQNGFVGFRCVYPATTSVGALERETP